MYDLLQVKLVHILLVLWVHLQKSVTKNISEFISNNKSILKQLTVVDNNSGDCNMNHKKNKTSGSLITVVSNILTYMYMETGIYK